MPAEPSPASRSERLAAEAEGTTAATAPRLRDETDTERLDRNLVELLQEVRVVQTGVQVLFAFLLTVPFSARFDAITDFQRAAYFTALVGAAAASVLLIAPTAVHRLLFRLGQKQYMVDVSNRLAVGGLLSTAVAMIAVMLLVSDVMFGMGIAIAVTLATTLAFAGVWALLPLRQRRRVLAARRRPGGR
jgi:Family of unknown function (DUF6328)